MPDEHGDIRPIPDPTLLTTAALHREVEGMQRRLDGEIGALKELHNFDVRSVREALRSDVEFLREVGEAQGRVDSEKFATIQLRFDLIERQRLELKVDNQKALDTALAGASAALNNLADVYRAGHATVEAEIEDVKLRMAGMEAERASVRQTSATTYALIGVLLTVIWIAITALALFLHH